MGKDEDVELAPSLVRSAGGTRVHRPDCGYLNREDSLPATVWTWAIGRPLEEVRAAVPMTGAIACKHCRPVS